MTNSSHGAPPGGYTIGVGLTDRCNSSCPHCYSRPQAGYTDLDYDKFILLLDALPIKSVNFGTGESILYSSFVAVVRLLSERGIETAVTTNGRTIAELSDEILRLFHDVDFSLDFPDRETHDGWRGEGSFRSIIEGVNRCRDLGVEASLVACLMKNNYTSMGKMAELAACLGVNLRVNVYKPVFTRKFKPSYEEFWWAIKDLATTAYFIGCSEPIVSAAIGNHRTQRGHPCGKMSFRVHPDGSVVSCVYLRKPGLTIDSLVSDFEAHKRLLHSELELALPEICITCDYVAICNGGCASRRIYGRIAEPDEYCFVARGHQPEIKARWKESKGLIHENYLCTMIFSD